MYELVPLLDRPERAEIISTIVKKACSFDTAFSDFQSVCDDRCPDSKDFHEFCNICKLRAGVVALALRTGITWEVWNDSEVVGIIRLSDIRPGLSATGHYLFFDRQLNSKTEVIQAAIDWAFAEHEGWAPLKRISVDIPDFAFALARHASKKLGFGGPFQFNLKGKKIPVEGVTQRGILWRGVERDLLHLGLLNPNSSS